MKIQLTKLSDEKTQTGYQPVPFRKIKDIEPASCQEIIANDCLDFTVERGALFNSIVNKLSYNGTLILYGLNIDLVSNDIAFGKLTSSEFNEILYSNKRQSCDSSGGMIIAIESHGLKILSIRNENYYYCIKAQRVQNG